MLIYKEYSMGERFVICDSCNTILNRQERNIYPTGTGIWLSNKGMADWKYCPYCGDKLYNEETK